MPTASQVSLALDLIDTGKPVPAPTYSRAMQVLDDALGTAGWTGAVPGAAPYGQLPPMDDMTAAKLEAFDKVADFLFRNEQGELTLNKFYDEDHQPHFPALADIMRPFVPGLPDAR